MGPNNIVMTCTPDGKNIVYRNRISDGFDGKLWSISKDVYKRQLYNKESMDIIQVIIFIIIIVAAIVQQISKTGKEKKTPSQKKVLADIFPEIEQENIEEDLPVSSVQTVLSLIHI